MFWSANLHLFISWRFYYAKAFLSTPGRTRGLYSAMAPISILAGGVFLSPNRFLTFCKLLEIRFTWLLLYVIIFQQAVGSNEVPRLVCIYLQMDDSGSYHSFPRHTTFKSLHSHLNSQITKNNSFID